MPILLSILIGFSFAAIEDVNITSNTIHEIDEEDNDYLIYGGIIDRTDGAVMTACSGTTACNTCTLNSTFSSGNPSNDSSSGTEVHVCNETAQTSITTLDINFKSTSTSGDEEGVGKHLLTTDESENRTVICNSTGDIQANASGSLSCSWGAICDAMDEDIDGNCDSGTPDDNFPASDTFRLGKDLNEDNDLKEGEDDFIDIKIHIQHADYYLPANTGNITTTTSGVGLRSYNLFPGDGKAYLLNNYQESSGLPELGSNVAVNNVRVYYVPSLSPACGLEANSFGFNTPHQDFAISDDSEFLITGNENTIKGLQNNQYYCFRTAIVDNTGFVTGYTDKMSTAYTNSATIPEKVAGLIEEGNCFIATAAYGSAIDKRLDIFRSFRDKILKRFTLGQKLTQMYYNNSKPLAIWIAKHEWARNLSQILLWPFLIFAYLLLNPIYLALLAGAGLIYFLYERKESAI